MKQAAITLHLNLTDAAEGAGWYIVASTDQGTVIDWTSIPPEAALALGRAFRPALEASDRELPAVLPEKLVADGNTLIRQALEAQLRKAEEEAARVAMLRRKLAALDPPSGMIPQSP